MEHFIYPILGEDQKKQNKIKKRSSPKIEHFFSPILGEDQKKEKVFSKRRTLFPQIYAQLYTLLNYWGGCRSEPFSNYWGGYSQIIGGIYPLHPPRVSAPLIESLLLAPQHIFHSHNVVKKNNNFVLL